MMAKTSLPPGFRFHPTDVELVWYYLKRKIMGKSFRFAAIAEVELYNFAPWDLPDKSWLCNKDLKWYFFCPRDVKYPNGSRANRATSIGYWKSIGKDKTIIHNSFTIGMRKTLVFHVGKPPKGSRTDWVMYEYRLENKELVAAGFLQDAYVLCKIFMKHDSDPKTGVQYGAPFNEEDYGDDDTSTDNSFPFLPQSLDDQEQSMPSRVVEMSSNADPLDTDGILLDELVEFLSSPLMDSVNAENDSSIVYKNVKEASSVNPEEIFNELEKHSSQAVISDNIYDHNSIREIDLDHMISELDSGDYLELNDFLFVGSSEPSTSMHSNQSHVPDAVS